MAEDVNLQASVYDEDLCENPFFKYMQTKQKQIYDEAASKRWTICVPRQGTLPRGSFNQSHVENHILKPVEDKSSAFKTVNNKEVQVSGDFIVTTEGFQDVKSVRVLFEETFFNSNNQSFPVLCINQPLEGGIGGSLEPNITSLESLQACCEFLWSSAGSKQSQKQIDDILLLFNSTYEQLEGESLRHLMDAAHAIYTRAMQAALKNSQLRRLTQHNGNYMDNIKLAIETYVMNELHDQLLRGISSIFGKEDAVLNKTTRNLAEIQIRDLGIKEQLRTNLPRGKRALSFLNRYKTPLEKFHCLKKTVTIVTDRKMKTPEDAAEAITVDDLLPALIFLIIKSDIPNCLNSPFLFSVQKISSPWLVRETDGADKVTALEKLFEFASSGNEEEVEKLLSSGREPVDEKFCHPLCACDKCEKLHSSKRHDPFAVTVFSRDDLGRTVLHVASEYGHSSLMYKLIKRGAVVNAMDYNGTTALHLACQRGHSSAALVLMHYKADVNAPDNDGNTPLHLCTANGHEKCTKALIFFDTSLDVLKVNAANEHGDTPLHLASRWGYAELVPLLLENGASLEARNKDKATPLDSSHNKKSNSVVERPLIHSKEFPNAVSEDQEKTKEIDRFIRSVANGDVELRSRQAAERIIHPNVKNGEGNTPLHFAAIRGYEEMTNLLLRRGAQTDAKNYTQMRAPLHFACQYNHPRVAGLLLSNKAKINIKDYKGNSPLHLCCFAGHLDPASVLIGHGANVNLLNDQGNTPLHVAARGAFQEQNALFQSRLLVSCVDDFVAAVIPEHYYVLETWIAFVFNRFSGGRDDVIRALDQASGISFDARTKRLSYSSHNSPYEQGRDIHTSSVLTGFEVVNSRYGASLSTRLDGRRTQQDVMNILSGCKKGFENDF
ncbi:Ankyrin repeat domain-containing protein 27 [Stylophora pistillata]|uniref:Ankyrin repeat domain-containing protein 27 n=1 Tax=Stylophora pistillata TaxID=50429 RepID=A0A2B4SSP4_STYPI|nr:Ankyrin repeat domain-containing protein 27 [Stylophora pistillata]